MELLPPCELFYDWSPPHVLIEKIIDFDTCHIYHSKNTGNNEKNTNKWSYSGNEDTIHWGIKFNEKIIISQIKISFNFKPVSMIVEAKSSDYDGYVVCIYLLLFSGMYKYSIK